MPGSGSFALSAPRKKKTDLSLAGWKFPSKAAEKNELKKVTYYTPFYKNNTITSQQSMFPKIRV